MSDKRQRIDTDTPQGMWPHDAYRALLQMWFEMDDEVALGRCRRLTAVALQEGASALMRELRKQKLDG